MTWTNFLGDWHQHEAALASLVSYVFSRKIPLTVKAETPASCAYSYGAPEGHVSASDYELHYTENPSNQTSIKANKILSCRHILRLTCVSDDIQKSPYHHPGYLSRRCRRQQSVLSRNLRTHAGRTRRKSIL